MPLAPAAIAIIFNDDKSEILLVKRKDVPVWVLPGGGIEPSELPQEAVIREVKEETGLHVEIERQSGEYTPINRLGALTFVFVCHIKSGKSQLSNETSDIAFFKVDKFPSLFFQVHKKWVEDAYYNPNLTKKPLEGISYKDFLKCLLIHPIYTLRYLWTRFIKK